MSTTIEKQTIEEIDEIINDLEKQIDKQYGATMVVWSHG